MKALSALLALFCTLLAVNATNPHDNLALSSRHAKLAQRAPEPALQRKNITKRCANKKKKTAATNNAIVEESTSSSAVQAPTTTVKKTSTTTSASSKKEATPTSNEKSTSDASSNNVSSGSTIKVSSGNCGASGATKKTTATCGPNGCIDWLNCGINGGGWTPPELKIEDLVTQSLSTAIQASGSPFKACSEYVSIFEQYGAQYGIPAIMLASFAMQESSCNPNTVGGGGEQGLMQLTKDKCGDAPGGNCKEPNYNIKTGAKYFADTLNGNGGNVIVSVGSYNGWYPGLTYDKATAARHSSCCRCQNNLDYLHQFFNGWLQNINAYDNSFPLGKYFNLNVC
jgi:hypothetical protein